MRLGMQQSGESGSRLQDLNQRSSVTGGARECGTVHRGSPGASGTAVVLAGQQAIQAAAPAAAGCPCCCKARTDHGPSDDYKGGRIRWSCCSGASN